jgi:polysaccharide biosynthesis transport protein
MESPQYPTAAGAELGSKIGVRFYRYRAVLKRYWWILALTIGIGLLYESYVVVSKPERYVSQGKLSVRVTSIGEKAGGVASLSSWYTHIMEELKGIRVREHARAQVQINKPEWVAETEPARTEINAENVPNTYFFVVTGTGRNAEFTQYFVDTVMKSFLSIREDEENRENIKALQQIMKRQSDETRMSKDSEEALRKFLEEIRVPLPEDREKQLTDQTNKIQDTIDRYQSELNVYKSMTNNDVLRGSTPNGATPNAGVREESVNPAGSSLTMLKQLRAKRQVEFTRKKEIWTSAHPRYKLFQEELDSMDAEIQELEKLAKLGREAQILRIENELTDAKTKFLAVKEESVQWSTVMVKYRQLRGNLDSMQVQVRKTDDELAKLKNEQRSSGEIIGIYHQALPPYEEQRGVVRHLLTGLVGGFLLGLGILFLLDRADDRLASSSEMIEQFAEPILGQIPDVADTRTQAGLPLLQEDDSRYMFAEAFRSLRSSLIFMPNQTELKTLIVTSAIPNEGKSTVASNLAITMSAAGAKVLLVDADLRRGDIAALFDIDGRQGLSNVLRGEVTWQNSMQEVRGGKLHIIPRGPVTNQSGELLLLPIVQKLLDEWKSKYDLIVFNTAPILATDDTPTLAPNFDGTLMVIRASFTSARLTRNALNALYQRQVNVLGLIMNCVDTELPDYYYYRYPKYYAADA